MSSREEQVLARLIADERSVPQPERDWTRIESGIVARLDRASLSPLKRSRERLYTAVGLAAAAALGLIAAGLMEPARTASPHARPATTISESARKANTAASSQEPGTTTGSGHVEHAGRAHWTLEPGSSARVRRDGTSIVVELDAGSIDAEVEPGRDPETFVVQAGDVRVTVHGAQFRVERRGETVDVSVWEGVVLVGSKDDPAGAKLPAPGGKRFIEGRLSSGAAAHTRPLPGPGRPRSALPGEPSISDVEAGVSRIQAAAQTCFARHTSAKDGVQVSVRSSVALAMRPDGSVVVQGFEPPLHPNVEGCTRAAISAVRIAASQRGIELSRTLDLKR